MNHNDCALTISIYGNNEKRIDSLKTVISKIFEKQIFIPNIYVMYLTFDGNNLLEDLSDKVNLIHIDGGERHRCLFQKESLYNLSISRTKEKYLAFMDADLYSDDPFWLMKCFDLVDQYERKKTDAVIQMYERYEDAEEGRIGGSYAFRMQHGPNNLFPEGSPGGGWALSRRLLERGGNFNQFCIPGSGDCCFVMEYTGDKGLYKYHFSYKWFSKIFRDDLNINAIADYTPATVTHIHHGSYKKRAYQMSRKIIDSFGYIEDLIELDENKLLVWKDPECGLKYVLENKEEISGEIAAYEKASKYMKIPQLPEVEERQMLTDTALITCYFGSNQKLLEASKKAFRQILRLDPTPFIVFVEVIEGETQWKELESIDFVHHVKIQSKKENKYLFQKEACFNIGTNQIDLNKYKFLIFNDCDTYPLNKKWASLIRKRINKWIEENETYDFILQNYSVYIDSVEKAQRDGYAFAKSKSVAKDGPVTTAAGLSWSMRSEFFKKSNGWYTKAFTGPNDAVALARWDIRCKYYKAGPDIKWLFNIYKEVEGSPKAIVDYLPVPMMHVFHGKKTNRAYAVRRRIIKSFCENVNDFVYEDEQGLLAWKNINNEIYKASEKTKGFSKDENEHILSQYILSKTMLKFKDAKFFCLDCHLQSVISKYLKMENSLFSFIQPTSISGVKELVTTDPKKLFQNCSENHLKEAGVTILKDDEHDAFTVYTSEKSKKSKIEKIRKCRSPQEIFEKEKKIIFICDLYVDQRNLESICSLKQKLNKICPQNILIALNYSKEAKLGPQIKSPFLDDIFIITLKKFEKNRREKMMSVQYEMVADILKMDEEKIADIKWRKFLPLENRRLMGNGSLSILGKAILNTEELEGDVVEIGCYKGETTLFLQNVLKECESTRKLHAYDSFQGFPEQTAEDKPKTNEYKKGSICCSLIDFKKTFIGKNLPEVHKGFVGETLPEQLPDRISLALVDCDLYAPVKHSLEQLTERITPHGIIFVHDYEHPDFPGVKTAVEEFLEEHGDSYNKKEMGNMISLTKKEESETGSPSS